MIKEPARSQYEVSGFSYKTTGRFAVAIYLDHFGYRSKLFALSLHICSNRNNRMKYALAPEIVDLDSLSIKIKC